MQYAEPRPDFDAVTDAQYFRCAERVADRNCVPDTDAVTLRDADTGSHVHAGADSDTGDDAAPDTDAGPNPDADTDSGADADTDSGTDADTDSCTDADTDPGTDADTDPGTDAEADPGTDACADPKTDIESDPGADSGADAGTDAGAHSDTDTAVGGMPDVSGFGRTYGANVSNASVDQNSAAYISSMEQAGDTGRFYASTGVEQVNTASNSTPMMTVHPDVSYHKFPVPYPWQSGFYIEPLSDAHSMVVQTQSCHLYEAYDTSFSGYTLSAYSGANWDMTKPYAALPPGTPSAMASGLPMFAGMVTWTDYESGAISHPLNWAAVAGSVSQYGFVAPASATDQLAFKGSSSFQLPYGARLRLKASFSTAGWGPQATMVATAMKNYGIYLADTGSSENALYFANAPNGTNPWNSADLSALGELNLNDFDVLTLPTIQTIPGHQSVVKRHKS